VWGALASLIAGAPVYRMANRLGKYPRPEHPPRITSALPARPAAVAVHGADGSVATLCLDLDTSKALQLVVDRDAAAIGALLQRIGAGFVADHSPSGGRHIYIPLAARIPFERARDLVAAFGRRFASLDPIPHLNPTDGCIRPPGSVHKRGGHQILDTPLPDAVRIMRERNPETILRALEAELAPQLHLVRRRGADVDRETLAELTRAGTTMAPRSGRGAGSPLRRTARTGLYDAGKYAGHSEARMAVLNHLVRCAWSYADVLANLHGDLAGLAGLYGPTKRLQRLLPAEWAIATAYIGRQATGSGQQNHTTEIPREKHALNYDTSQPLSHSGGTQPVENPKIEKSARAVQQEISEIENLCYTLMDPRLARLGRRGIGLRLLLRAVLGFARTTGSLTIDVGCRSFAIATGRDHATIARLLPQLEQVTDGLVTRIERGRGKNADLYLIQIPAQHRGVATAISWRRGKIHAIRPVFRALGDVAALVYETIERADQAPTTAQIAVRTGIGRTAVDAALATMVGLGMIERRHGTMQTGWSIIAGRNLTILAEQLGVLDDLGAQITRYRKDRAAWHAWLDRHHTPALTEYELHQDDVENEWIPPAEDELALLARIWTAA
jgi:hypothetical protein